MLVMAEKVYTKSDRKSFNMGARRSSFEQSEQFSTDDHRNTE